MNAQQIRASEDFQRCADFHGHICPGLSIGYKATKAAMHFLQQQQRAEDEELVAIVETDACSADAVQVLTGCTFGKGNFIYKDYGKMALTLMDRKTGKGVRVCTRQQPFEANSRHGELLPKMMPNFSNCTNSAVTPFWKPLMTRSSPLPPCSRNCRPKHTWSPPNHATNAESP